MQKEYCIFPKMTPFQNVPFGKRLFEDQILSFIKKIFKENISHFFFFFLQWQMLACQKHKKDIHITII